jgi:hypothetical protein
MIDFTITPSNRASLYEKIVTLDVTRLWQCTIVERKTKRSNLQNKMYWAFLGEWAQQYGGTAEEMHHICKVHFLLIEYVEILGERFARTQSTPRINTKEFAEYFERCIAYAAQQGFIFEMMR